jgi:hypothetical protein
MIVALPGRGDPAGGNKKRFWERSPRIVYRRVERLIYSTSWRHLEKLDAIIGAIGGPGADQS